jgi:hypothetical protein
MQIGTLREEKIGCLADAECLAVAAQYAEVIFHPML